MTAVATLQPDSNELMQARVPVPVAVHNQLSDLEQLTLCRQRP